VQFVQNMPLSHCIFTSSRIPPVKTYSCTICATTAISALGLALDNFVVEDSVVP